MRLLIRHFIPAFIGLLALQSSNALAVGITNSVNMPNGASKSLTTPTAWGASNNVVFFGGGGTIPSPYSTKNDGAAVLGCGLGDSKKNIGVQLVLISNDVDLKSGWKEYSGAVQLSRQLGNANAIAVGVDNVPLINGQMDDSGKSYYVVYSQGVQAGSFVNETTGNSKLTYSIGVGTGQFSDKSAADIGSGKGAHGTYVFGNIAYELVPDFNVICDWNGVNLNAGLSHTFYVAHLPISVLVGAADLTDYSGDGVRCIFAVGTGFAL